MIVSTSHRVCTMKNIDFTDFFNVFLSGATIIEVCLLLSSRVSNEFEDYFYDKDDYAAYLKSYVDFDNSDMPSEYSALVEFSDQGKVDLYVDPSNPKVNRNIVQSKLFAADYILRDIIEPVSKDEIEDFYKGVPVEQNVVAIFMAICPAFPIPLVTSFPPFRCTCSTISSTAFSNWSVTGISRMA